MKFILSLFIPEVTFELTCSEVLGICLNANRWVKERRNIGSLSKTTLLSYQSQIWFNIINMCYWKRKGEINKAS